MAYKHHFFVYTSSIFTFQTKGYAMKNEPRLNKKLIIFGSKPNSPTCSKREKGKRKGQLFLPKNQKISRNKFEVHED